MEVQRTFKHAYVDATSFFVVEYQEGISPRKVDSDYPEYAEWVAQGNVPEKMSGDRFVSIVDGQPVVDPNKQATLTAEKWMQVRSERNARVSAADWTQLEDAPFDASKKQAWRAYRQALRDLPQTQHDPFNIVWPTPPEVQ